MVKKHIGEKIKEARKNAAFTQAQLAEKCRLDIRTIQRIESGIVMPRYYTIALINEALGTTFNVEKDIPTHLRWKKGFFNNTYYIFNGHKIAGTLVDRSLSQSGIAEYGNNKYSFKTKGLFRQETQIIDNVTHNQIGNIRYNLWMNKAELTINHEILYWKYDDWVNTKWIISNCEGVQIRYFGTPISGRIESTVNDDILIITGLFVTNYYWILLMIMIVLGFLPIWAGIS